MGLGEAVRGPAGAGISCLSAEGLSASLTGARAPGPVHTSTSPPSSLQHSQGLVHNFLEGHGRPSTALALPHTDRRFLQPRDYLAKAPRVYQEHRRIK